MAKKTYDPASEVAKSRDAAFEHVADEVSGLLRRAGLGRHSDRVYRRKRIHEDVPGQPYGKGRHVGIAEINRRLGRSMTRTLWVIQQGDADTSISTLADLAFASGHRLRISFEPVSKE